METDAVTIKLDRDVVQYFSNIEREIFNSGRFFASRSFFKNHNYDIGGEEFAYLVDEPETVICPCSSTDCYNGMWSDYVSHPMIWCSGCGRRSFICIECEPKVTECENFVSYTYPLMNVDVVINCQIYSWLWGDNTFKHFKTFAAIRDKSVKNYNLNLKDENEKTIVQISGNRNYIPYETQLILEELFAENINLRKSIRELDYKDESSWKHSVNCNSTNALDVKIPLDMSHDGISIYCKCHCEKCKTVIYANYSGD
jgi:hypothetical protein